MEKIITYDTLRRFCYSNDSICKKPIQGIVLSFFGLGGDGMFDEDTEVGKQYAEQGIVYVIPYYNPWAWMNQQTVFYVDQIVDVLMEQYHLPGDLPVISTGGSMGGLSALVYTVYAKHTPAGCVANCPVCDLPYHYTERDDVPRTVYSAFLAYDGTLEEALKATSPIDLMDRLPDIEYYIFHCEQDQAVNKQKHSDRFVRELAKQHTVTYHEVPDCGHCALPEDMLKLYQQYPIDMIKAYHQK